MGHAAIALRLAGAIVSFTSTEHCDVTRDQLVTIISIAAWLGAGGHAHELRALMKDVQSVPCADAGCSR